MAESKKALVEYFHDLQEVFKKLDEPKSPDAENASRKEHRRHDWDLGVGYDGAVQLLRGGWQEGMDKASELLDALDIRTAKGNSTEWDYGVSGPLVDIGEYMAGNPECLLEPIDIVGQGNVYLSLYAGYAASCETDARVILARGVAIAALVDRLERIGIRIKLHAYNAVDGYGGVKGAFVFHLKDYHHRLCLNDIMFGFAHPAMLRRITFAVYERSRHQEIRKMTHCGYGMPSTMNASHIDCEPGSVFIDGVGHGNKSNNPEEHLYQIMVGLPADVRDLIERRERGEDV